MKKSLIIVSIIVILSMLVSITAFGGQNYETPRITVSAKTTTKATTTTTTTTKHTTTGIPSIDDRFDTEELPLTTKPTTKPTTQPTTAARISISKCSISNIKSKVYTGKNLTQAPTVKYSGKTLKLGTDYKLSYKNNKYVGTATVTITGIGKYKSSVSKTFKINPKSTSVSKLTSPKKGQLKVTWKKQSTQTTGYQIMIATNKSFSKNKKTITISSNKTTSKVISKLTSKKTYYVKVRTYKTVNKVKYYSSWSAVKNIKIK